MRHRLTHLSLNQELTLLRLCVHNHNIIDELTSLAYVYIATQTLIASTDHCTNTDDCNNNKLAETINETLIH